MQSECPIGLIGDDIEIGVLSDDPERLPLTDAADPDRARAMTACAAELVDTSYSRAAVAPIVRDAVLGVRASA